MGRYKRIAHIPAEHPPGGRARWLVYSLALAETFTELLAFRGQFVGERFTQTLARGVALDHDAV